LGAAESENDRCFRCYTRSECRVFLVYRATRQIRRGRAVITPMMARGFPLPWTVEDNRACFIVRDKNGLALACCYYEEEPGPARCAPVATAFSRRNKGRK
jgi:hypothetical protein